LRVSGPLGASGSLGRLMKEGEGTLELTGDNSGLAGGVTLGVAGTPPLPVGRLIVHDASALGTNAFHFDAGTLEVAGVNAVVFANSINIGAGQIGAGAVFSGAPIEFTGAASLFRPASTLSFQHRITANTRVTFSGGLNGNASASLGLTIGGSGQVLVTNTANIAVTITVDGAELSVFGGFPALPSITVQGGGVLSGETETGERLGPIVITADGRIAPGELPGGPGTLNIGALTLSGTFEIDLHGTAVGNYDRLSVTGTVALSGSVALNLGLGYVPSAADSFTIILNDGTDAVSGEFAGKPDGWVFSAQGTFFAIDYQGGDGNDVVLTVIPEPGSTALLVAGAVLVGARRRGCKRGNPSRSSTPEGSV